MTQVPCAANRKKLVAEPETGLITDCEMTMAAGPGCSDADGRRHDGRPRPVL